ncbi:MAG: redoxin domain-containing protein [Deltaproteobacteria bacterium]|nr:redoxin domain-containing protein [Deltaproteobacteria bacterium]
MAMLTPAVRRRLIAAVYLGVAAAIWWTAKGTGLYVDRELLQLNNQAKDFGLPRLDGNEQTLSALANRDNVVWIIFGRTDDKPSRIQLNEARTIAEDYREFENLRILFLANGQSAEEINEFVKAEGSAAMILLDKGGITARRYKATTWPTSYIVDQSRTIRGGHRGVWRAHDRQLNKLLRTYLLDGPGRSVSPGLGGMP